MQKQQARSRDNMSHSKKITKALACQQMFSRERKTLCSGRYGAGQFPAHVSLILSFHQKWHCEQYVP